MPPVRIMFFCLGNICRSPLAEGIFRHHVERAGFAADFHIESSGTSAYHVGEPPDMGSQRVVQQRLGVSIADQRAQQLSADHLRDFDVLVAMDASNRANARRLGHHREIMLLRDFEPNPPRGGDVPDPWGGGANQFELVYEIVHRCTGELLDTLIRKHGLKP